MVARGAGAGGLGEKGAETKQLSECEVQRREYSQYFNNYLLSMAPGRCCKYQGNTLKHIQLSNHYGVHLKPIQNNTEYQL